MFRKVTITIHVNTWIRDEKNILVPSPQFHALFFAISLLTLLFSAVAHVDNEIAMNVSFAWFEFDIERKTKGTHRRK